MSRWLKLALATLTLAAAGYAYWKLAIPTHRVEFRSELVMLGDLDGDNRWAKGDLAALEAFLKAPFFAPVSLALRLDLNRNGLIDDEDLRILRALVAANGDPYAAQASQGAQAPFPRPRELYLYSSTSAFRPRPALALSEGLPEDSAVRWLDGGALPVTTYAQGLEAAIHDETVRFDQAYRMREPGLEPIEREYTAMKLKRLEALSEGNDRFELLLALIDLVEDAETLTTRGQPEFAIKLLTFRDHLREVLASPGYAQFAAGKEDWRSILRVVAGHLKADLGLEYDFETLGPPRNFTDLENYLQRGEWQYYKSSASQEDFTALIAYAQNDPRYLRAVSRISRRMEDPSVLNHNLPMVLLFREALRIKGGDKKMAVGLLDEAIRIPFAWIKSIPREALPSSLALDNFLLPGNMEDGADKSRHWNVFGGICLYKSPQEALDLALKREMKDLREAQYSEPAMREFLRDMIANLNGMFHVMTVEPGLLKP